MCMKVYLLACARVYESVLNAEIQKGLVVCIKGTYCRESEGLGRVYESVLSAGNQKDLVVCMKVLFCLI